MRKIFDFLAIVLLFGCATELKVIYPFEKLYKIDFTPYTQKGFLITPEKYTGTYESIGLISFTAMPGAVYKEGVLKINPYYEPGRSNQFIQNFEWITDSISFDKVLLKVYEICKSMGADALVNFHDETVSYPYTGIKNPTTITGYSITGFAIKRKDK